MGSMTKDTRETIKTIYSMLDYNQPFEKRMEIVKDISENYMPILCKTLLSKNELYTTINYCMDAVSNYILFAKDAPYVGDYPYTVEDNFKMTNNGKFKTTHKFEPTDNTQYKNIKNTIQSYLERDDVPSYIYDYITYMENTRYLIEQVEQMVKDYKKPVTANHLFMYKNKNNKPKAILYKDYVRIRQATGYTKNNSVLFDKEILYMLQSHYEPMRSTSPTANVWIDTFKDVELDDEYDIDLLDFDSVSCLLKAMCYYGESPIFDSYFKQLDELVHIVKLNELQLEIYNMLKDGKKNKDGIVEKFSLGAIASSLQKDRKQINRNFESMVKKIIEEYERVFEDNVYYLDIVKGKYKTCTICGKVLLATESNFYKDNSGQFGLRGECKTCFSKNP